MHFYKINFDDSPRMLIHWQTVGYADTGDRLPGYIVSEKERRYDLNQARSDIP